MQRQGLGVAELVGTELQQGFASRGGPEFLRAFHTLVDLLHRRFDVAGRDRQSLAAVIRVVHPRLLVGQIGQRRGHDLPGVGFAGVGRGRAEFRPAGGQFGDHRAHPSLPDPSDPAEENRPSFLFRASGHRPRVEVGQRVDEVQNRRELQMFEMPLPDAPVGRLPVGDEGLRFRRREAQRPGGAARSLPNCALPFNEAITSRP